MNKPAIGKTKPFGLTSGWKPLVYLKEVRTELEKVAWPKREQAIRLTLIVASVSVITALFLGGFDFVFTKLMAITLGR